MRFTKFHALMAAALALLLLPAVAQAKDRDRDGLPDGWERRNGLSTVKKSGNKDPDRDRVDNRNEYRERTRPRDRDTDNDRRRDGREDRDGDGLNNAAEDRTGNDPVDKDTDNDGIPDGQEQAGTVTAYDTDTGELTIDLANGDPVTGKVTDETRVRCATEFAAERSYRRRHRRGRAAHRGGRGGPGGPGGGDFGPGPGDGEFSGEGDDGEGFRDCGGADTADARECLVVGAKVHEAELSVDSEGAVWREIEILKPAE